MKCRIFRLHKNTNRAKVTKLEALHAEYVSYARTCVQTMLDQRTYSLPKSAKQAFFPRASNLTSQIEKNARGHAIAIVSTWAKATYARKLKPTISNLQHEGILTDLDAKALYVIGKKQISKPWKFITQDHLDVYHTLLDTYGGNTPTVRDTFP